MSIENHTMRSLTPMVHGIFLLLVILVILACACASKEPQEQPNIVLVSLDTLRSDFVGCMGNSEVRTPTLDRFAGKSVTFEAAAAHEPFTLPSHMSMLTGMYPDRHQVDKGRALSRDIPLMAEYLEKAGYETAAFLACPGWLGEEYGFQRGFQHFINEWDLSADQIVEGSLQWLKERKRPFFLFVHCYDIHSEPQGLPYQAPHPFMSRTTQSYGGSFDGSRGDGDETGTSYLRYLNAHKKTSISEEDLKFLQGLYAAGVDYTDSALANLFSGLHENGQLRDSLVIVTSDHGEEFREHGAFLHSQVFEECLSVPLFLKMPDGAFGGERSDAAVGHVDLLPTILDVAGIQNESYEMSDGRPLLDLLQSNEEDQHVVISRSKRWGGRFYTARQGEWKLFYKADRGAVALFRLSGDPGETRNLVTHRPEVVERLKAPVVDYLRSTKFARGVHLRFYGVGGEHTRVEGVIESDAEIVNPDGLFLIYQDVLEENENRRSLRFAISLPPGRSKEILFELRPVDSEFRIRLAASGESGSHLPFILGRNLQALPAKEEILITSDQLAVFSRMEEIPKSLVRDGDRVSLLLYRATRSAGSGSQIEVSTDETERLKALGYVE